ncbi:lysophospholipid acyltransferase family protein [Halobacteriovorax sp.]|uniref:lysophospholipid acyltransferase family protein n=1 Tax=Halobacteriovorax sp. TaxID=2020862 RepID=UPI003AF31260
MKFLLKLVPTLVSWYLRFVRLTSKITILNKENLEKAKSMSKHGNYALAAWHEHYPTSVISEIDTGMIVMASKSKDGTLAADTVMKLGFTPTRGSSSRGGAQALESMINQISQTSLCAAITVDGPRGPRHKPKRGIVHVSHECEIPILPIQCVSSRHICFEKSWDKTKLPKPFGHIYINYGEPFFAKGLNKEDLIKYSEQIVASQELLTKENRLYVDF